MGSILSKWLLFALTLFILFSFVTAAHADSVAPNVPFKQYSSSKLFYIEMTPSVPYGEKGSGIARRADTGQKLWDVQWYARIILCNDGVHMIRFGPWASDYENLTDLAYAFYKNGVEMKRYTVRDLIKDRSKIKRTVSHYFWNDRDPSSTLSQDEKRFNSALIDGTSYTFDVHTGSILTVSDVASDQKNNEEKARKLRVEGEELQKKGQLAAAVEKYELSQKYYPDPKLAEHIKVLRNALTKQYMDTAKKLRAEGEALQKKGQLAAAIEKYEEAQKYYPDKNLAAHILKLRNALSATQRVVIKFEDDGDPEGFSDEMAAIENIKKDPSKANVENLAAIRYRHAVNLTWMATKKNDKDMYRLALFYAKSATELAPDKSDYWFLLGQLYEKFGGYELAEDALVKAVELKPGDAKMRLFLGQFFYRHDYYNAALEQFEIVLRKDTKLILPQTVTMVASAYLLDSQYARGVNFFRDILGRDPGADGVRIALAILLRRQKNSPQAIEELNKITNRLGASEENRKYALTLLEDWKKEGVKP